MSKKYRVVQAKEIPGRDKPLWLRLGTAFEKDGKPLSIKLDVLPMPNKDGDVWLRLFEDDGQGAGAPAAAGGFSSAGNAGVFSAPIGEAAAAPRDDLDQDNIPF